MSIDIRIFKNESGFNAEIKGHYDQNLLILINPKTNDIKEIYKQFIVNKEIIALVSRSRMDILKAMFNDISVFDISEFNSIDEFITRYESLKSDSTKLEYDFTPKEEMFLSELAYGMSMKEMKYELMMSERSIRRIKEKLLSKTGLSSTQQLAIFASNKGY